MNPNRYRKKDKNHEAIKEYLKDHAGELELQDVVDTSGFKDGFPDLLIILANGVVLMLFEIKSEYINPHHLESQELPFMLQMVSPNYRIIKTTEAAHQAITELNDITKALRFFNETPTEPNPR